ncbi:hypothetical protein PIB30_006469 [Stylosanthes scabra]|uniref:Uncharacterized protein n=1 Tax=Stylosanthes scabra TaxID=79078 RepID=A0ABU6V424_9FABA|nr:hypothetical protein [Stylosanthes scabra]
MQKQHNNQEEQLGNSKKKLINQQKTRPPKTTTHQPHHENQQPPHHSSIHQQKVKNTASERKERTTLTRIRGTNDDAGTQRPELEDTAGGNGCSLAAREGDGKVTATAELGRLRLSGTSGWKRGRTE